jgi:hypothetical protein
MSSGAFQLACMHDRQSLEGLLSSGRDLQEDTAAVRSSSGVLAHYESRFLAPIAELDNGIVAQTKALSRIADRHNYSIVRSCDLEEELMLLWLKTELLRSRLTGVEKRTELVAKFGDYLRPTCQRRCSFSTHHCSSIS